MSGFQLSGDAPTFYMRYAYAVQEPWTDDLILQARCKDGERVLDVACGPGLVAGQVNRVSNATCKIAGIDINEAMLNTARRDPGYRLASRQCYRSAVRGCAASTWCSASKGCNSFPIVPPP